MCTVMCGLVWIGVDWLVCGGEVVRVNDLDRVRFGAYLQKR